MNTSKLIDRYYCPCCGTVLSATYMCDMTECKSYFGHDTVYRFYRFPCPRTSKMITMVETSFMDMKFFWELCYENMMEKYVRFRRLKTKRMLSAFFYLYYPNIGELKTKITMIKDNMRRCINEGYVISIIMSEEIYNAIGDQFSDVQYHLWVLESKFFLSCVGNIYGSPLAELNIINESRQWSGYKLYTIYPTISSDFECIDPEIDWEKLKQLVLVSQ